MSLSVATAQDAGGQRSTVSGTIAQGIEEYSAALEIDDRNQRLEQFSRAEQLFRQAVEEQQQAGGTPSTELLVNLGNAALQANHIGHAIVAFRRALRQAPSHRQAAQNLGFARSTLPDAFRVDQTTQLVDTLFFWRSLYSRQQLLVMGALSFLCAAVLVALAVLWKNAALRNVSLIPWLVWGLLTFSLWQQGASEQVTAVITGENTMLYSADSENASPRLSEPLPDGTEVEVLAQRERWTEVQVGGRSGWLHAADLTLVPQ